MGAQNSNLRKCIEAEFKRLLKADSTELVLEDMLNFRLPASNWTVDPRHLGVLFVADRTKDGKYSLQDLLEFMEVARGRSRHYQPYDFQTQMHGYCTLQIWKCLSEEGGSDAFHTWMHKLLIANGPTTVFSINTNKISEKTMKAMKRNALYGVPENSELFISSDSILALHKLLNVQDNKDLGPQEFLDLLQCSAESMGLMELQNTEQDNWVPLAVIDELLGSIVNGITDLMSEIYPREELARMV